MEETTVITVRKQTRMVAKKGVKKTSTLTSAE
jgi:hypothetical protein